MTITSKFNKEDDVWIMHKNKPIKTKIKGVQMTHDCYDRVYVRYSISSNMHDIYNYSEKEVFATKEDLINSL